MIEYTVKVTDDGDKYWFLNGQLHREDGPAIECRDGNKRWVRNGQLHRVDGPAVMYAKGSMEWFLDGVLHREDGPAIEYANGTKYWYLRGVKVTEADVMNPKCPDVVEINRVKYQKVSVDILNKRQEMIEYYDGTIHWYLKGKLHREDGPAIEYVDGNKEWWLNGKQVTEADVINLKAS